MRRALDDPLNGSTLSAGEVGMGRIDDPDLGARVTIATARLDEGRPKHSDS